LALVFALAFVLWLDGLEPVRAWGGEGHRIIARIALSLMTSEAADQARALLDAEDFVAVSTWADAVRSERTASATWHFLGIPLDQPTYIAERDCAPTEHGDCVIAALVRARAAIGDPGRTADQRREALKFLIHFVGDFHQPLHDIGNHDRGGNEVAVDCM